MKCETEESLMLLTKITTYLKPYSNIARHFRNKR
ncbi:hypothetical protein T03_4290 [Trichinella britovi]|uniref:Uncharacterized protein n=1 Tax=Trichinella britovi TaxID=45882 RepID=A0A0V0Z258_TRIBR|nr:hypothetical protein T03_4290 [Trichinella britovi]